jgi:hypothetical protein
VSSTYTVTALASTYIGRAAFVDIYSWFDAWAYCFLLLAMRARGPIAVFILSMAAAWTDERAALALSLVGIWSITCAGEADMGRGLGSLFTGRVIAIILAALSYGLSRLYLGWHYGLSTPWATIPLRTHIELAGIGAWTFFDGLWIPIILGLPAMWSLGWRLQCALCAVSGLAMTAVAVYVFDMTRSGAYMFPLVFIVLIPLLRRYRLGGLRAILFVAAVVSVLFPAYFVITSLPPYVLWQKPLLVRLLQFFLIH